MKRRFVTNEELIVEARRHYALSKIVDLVRERWSIEETPRSGR